MNQNNIVFFSSDATALYKADVFRSLALPKGYTIQFRYGKRFVLDRFWNDHQQLANKEGIIVFVAGNDLGIPAAQRVLRPYPIRSCKVREVFRDENTEQFILILELCDFVAGVIPPITAPGALPGDLFVTETELSDLRPTSWINRVRAIESHFPDILFFQIVKILLGRVEISPSYSSERRFSFFQLEEESDYAVECSCYDPKGGQSRLRIRYKSEEVDVDNSFESGVGATLDSRRLPLITRGLKSRSAPAFFTFDSPEYGDDGGPSKDPNQVRIGWNLSRKWWKTWVFGSLTMLAAIGLVISQTSLKNQSGGWMAPCELLIKLVGVLAVGFAASQLFKFFNKT